MTVTSFPYFIFLLVGVGIYYLCPRKLQWAWLLCLSVEFYFLTATPYTFMYIVLSALLAWGVTNGISHFREQHPDRPSGTGWQIAFYFSVCLLIALWAVFKGRPLLEKAWSVVRLVLPSHPEFPALGFASALGMGYFTLQTLGYMLDCCWGNAQPQKNPFKLLLFICFFPQMLTGPISRYHQLQPLYEGHSFSYNAIAHGVQRIVWGLFKKLVVASQCALVIDPIWSDFATFGGFFTWLAFLLYPIQMYADFSGCMDIVIGSAELFGIALPENFVDPFFARSSQEFWQRWHITLGTWAKDYVLYPFLKSPLMIRLGKSSRKHFGKKAGKRLTTAVGMLALWLVMGIWHGDIKYIIGVSLWYWVILMLGDLLEPFFRKCITRFGFRTETFGWRLFQRVRTYLIYAVGALFFRASGIRQALAFLREMAASFRSRFNPWIFFDGSLLNLEISYKNLNLILLGILALLLVGILREKNGYARFWLDRQPVLFCWGIYLTLLFAVLIFGSYGPGYDASSFIYGNF